MGEKKVLIIDDEADFGLLLKAYFSHKGYQVHLSNTLHAGLHLLAEIQPDIVFLDNNLPDGLGWEKAETIRNQYPLTQLNLISAYHFDVPAQIDSSHVRIWEKPIKLDELNKYFE